MKPVIKQFIAELDLLNYSQSTKNCYASVVDQFIDIVGDKKQYEKDDIMTFLTHVPHLSNSSKQTYIMSIRRFLDFKDTPWPFKKRELMRQSSGPLPETLFTTSEIRSMFDLTKGNLFEYTVLRVLAVTGCRRGELCRLTMNDFKVPNVLAIPMEKGEGLRTVTMDDETAKSLVKYLKGRTDKNEALFINPVTKQKILPQAITMLVKRTAARLGIKKNGLGAHAFRRSLTTELIKNGVSPVAVQKFLGWKSPSMVERYSRLSPSSLEALVQLGHPLFKNEPPHSTA